MLGVCFFLSHINNGLLVVYFIFLEILIQGLFLSNSLEQVQAQHIAILFKLSAVLMAAKDKNDNNNI